VERYNLKTPEEIVNFFTYSNLKKFEPDFCPLFRENQICHPMPQDELVCYFCACPFFDFELWDEEKHIYGACKNKKGKGERNAFGYWDCSNCVIPHLKENALKLLKLRRAKDEY